MTTSSATGIDGREAMVAGALAGAVFIVVGYAFGLGVTAPDSVAAAVPATIAAPAPAAPMPVTPTPGAVPLISYQPPAPSIPVRLPAPAGHQGHVRRPDVAPAASTPPPPSSAPAPMTPAAPVSPSCLGSVTGAGLLAPVDSLLGSVGGVVTTLLSGLPGLPGLSGVVPLSGTAPAASLLGGQGCPATSLLGSGS